VKPWVSTRMNEAAFTYIELMVALGIVMSAVLFALAANTTVQHKSEEAVERTVAMQEAHQVIEEIRETARSAAIFPNDVVTAFPPDTARPGFTNLTPFCGMITNPPQNNCTWPFPFVPNNTSAEQVVVSYNDRDGDGNALNDNPLDVLVTVVWMQRDERPMSVALRSLITQRK